MKRMWRCCLLLVLISITSSIVVAGANSEGNVAVKLQRIWGTRMTVGEYLSLVSPGELAGLSAVVRNTPVIWGGEAGSIAGFYSAAEIGAGNGLVESSILDIHFDYTSKLYVSGKKLTYGSSTTILWPPFTRVPSMSLAIYLLEDGAIIGATSKTTFNVWRITKQDTCVVDGGAYYQTLGHHYIEAPEGYWPPVVFVVSYSVLRWVDE
jgi:hypothetical protein